jgi:hypothetical protein
MVCIPGTALITPLHKKGNKSDPNIYRAIAVGSNLGKLFSGILLDRLIQFRNSCTAQTHITNWALSVRLLGSD